MDNLVYIFFPYHPLPYSVDQIRRKSLVLRFPKEKLPKKKKRRRPDESQQSLDYLKVGWELIPLFGQVKRDKLFGCLAIGSSHWLCLCTGNFVLSNIYWIVWLKRLGHIVLMEFSIKKKKKRKKQTFHRP